MSTPQDTRTGRDYYSADAFFDAWLRGVELAGIEYFGGAWSEKAVPTKEDYRPDWDRITDMLGVLSTGEAAFLAAMYSFFNPRVGAKMLGQLGFGSPGALSVVLDEPRLRVIADLLVAYEGW